MPKKVKIDRKPKAQKPTRNLSLSASAARQVRGGRAASDIFAKLGDIKGESLDTKH